MRRASTFFPEDRKIPRNGAGSYSTPEPPFVPGTTIESTPVNSNFSDIASALTGSVASDGQTPMTGTLQMNTNAISGVTTITGVTGTFSGLVTGSNIGRGALISKSLDQSIPDATNTLVLWSVVSYNNDAIFDIGDSTKLTVPAGITRVRVGFSVQWQTNVTYVMTILKNGAEIVGGAFTTDSRTYGDAASAMLAVTAGDYFQLQVHQSGASAARNIVATDKTWITMELIR